MLIISTIIDIFEKPNEIAVFFTYIAQKCSRVSSCRVIVVAPVVAVVIIVVDGGGFPHSIWTIFTLIQLLIGNAIELMCRICWNYSLVPHFYRDICRTNTSI